MVSWQLDPDQTNSAAGDWSFEKRRNVDSKIHLACTTGDLQSAVDAYERSPSTFNSTGKEGTLRLPADSSSMIAMRRGRNACVVDTIFGRILPDPTGIKI